MTKRKIANAGIGATALVIVLGWSIPKGADAGLRAIDSRYVLNDTFRVFKHELREKAIVDSASAAAQWLEVRRMVASLDSTDKCRRGLRAFCR